MKLDLSEQEQAEAVGRRIYVVWYVYEEEDREGNDVTWGIPVSVHGSAPDAESDARNRAGPAIPGGNAGGKYLRHGPSNLFAFCQCGFADAATLRAVLRGAGPVELAPQVWYAPSYYDQHLKSPPLTDGEYRQTHAIQVWTVYYEDQMRTGPNRESYPVAVCLSAAEAQNEIDRLGPLKTGYAGHLMLGPHPLALHDQRTPDIGSDVVREVLRRLATGEPGPVPVR